MKNKNIILIIILAVLILGGGILAYFQTRKIIKEPETKTQELELEKEIIPEIIPKEIKNETIKWEKHTENIYRNEEFGFQLIMPSSWAKYATKKEKIDQSFIINFGLPLEINYLVDLTN